MKTLIYSLLTLACLWTPGYAQLLPETLKPVRLEGELLISYSPTHATTPRGGDIYEEHQAFLQVLSRSTGLKIQKAVPVHRSLVAQMTEQGISEAEVLRRYWEHHRQEAGLPRPDFGKWQFSRRLRVIFADEKLNLDALTSQLQHEPQGLEREGFTIREVAFSWMIPVDKVPNDPFYGSLYSHHITGAELAWDVSTGSSAVAIAIMDTGVDPGHEDLKDNLVTGFDFVDIDTTHPGFHQTGQKLVSGEDYFDRDPFPTDFDGHGTHLAGIAAGKGNNGKGVVGVCPECTIVPIRIAATYEWPGGILHASLTNFDFLDALVYSTNLGVDVISMSFSGPQYYMRNELAFASQNGVYMAGSAGNNNYATPHYPAADTNVTGVTNTRYEDTKFSASNYGAAVDVCAPGTQVLSALPKSHIYHPLLNINPRFRLADGTERLVNLSLFSAPFAPIQDTLVFVGKARIADLNDPTLNWAGVDGNIALIQGGDITVGEKVVRAEQYGARAAVVLYQYDQTIPGEWDPGTWQVSIPVLPMYEKDGLPLIDRLKNEILVATVWAELLEDYGRISGSSMATPYVAGLGGLLKSVNPALTPAEIRQLVKHTADSIDHLNPGYAGKLGSGRVNVARAVQAALQLPTGLEPEGIEVILPKVYPNPAHHQASIWWTEAARGSVSIRLLDRLGREVMQVQAWAGNQGLRHRLDIGKLAPGLYLVYLEQQGKTGAVRLLKE